jgi:hypothetical protein
VKRDIITTVVLLVIVTIVGLGSFFFGSYYARTTFEPQLIVKERVVETTVTRFPNTPPYTQFADPIEFDTAMLFLYGMRVSHVQALNWTFEGDPGFGIADKEFQNLCIKEYDQLMDFVWRQRLEIESLKKQLNGD